MGAATAQLHQISAPRQSPRLPGGPKAEFYHLGSFYSNTVAIWLPPDALQKGRRTPAGFDILLTLISYCTLHTSHQQPMDGCWEVHFNEICMYCPPAASYKLQQQCMYLVDIRNHTPYILLERTPNASSQEIINSHTACLHMYSHNACLETNSHNACLNISAGLDSKPHNTCSDIKTHSICQDIKLCNACLQINSHNLCLNINSHKTCLDRNVCIKTGIDVYKKEHRDRMYVKQPKHFSPISKLLGGPQLNLSKGVDMGVIRSTNPNISLSKICHSLKICACNRMSTSSNVAATTRKLFEQNVEPIDTTTSSQKKGVSVMIVSSQKKAKGKGVTLPRPPF